MRSKPITIVFAEDDNLFRLMEMALLRRATPEGERTLAYFFGPDYVAPLAELKSQADRLGLPPDIEAIVATDEATLDAALPDADVLVVERTPMTSSRLEVASARIKLIQQFGQDCRHIDLAAARRLRLPVADLLRLSNLSCADHSVALVLALARDLLAAHSHVKARRDANQAPGFPTDPPRNKFNWGQVRNIRVLAEHTIGFIGMGEIASLTATRLRAMGMRVIYFKRTPLSRAEEEALGGITFVPRDELLAQSDFVSINVPYSPATEKLVDAAFLAAMKPGSFLINTARGGIVDERALDTALRSGHLAGAALDVYRYEPVPPNCPLLDLDNVLWTPHISGGRPEFMVRESSDVLANIARVLRGEEPQGWLRRELPTPALRHYEFPTMLKLIGRLGQYWYVVPCLAVVVGGLATCSLIDVTDHDTFHVEASVPHASGLRTAVIVRQRHGDSGATMKCVWIIPGPPPSAGISPRLSPSCALVDTHPDAPLTLAWLANGRLGATVPAGILVAAEDERNQRCYFSTDRQRRVICYRSELIDIEQPR